MKAAVPIDSWKVSIFERHLKENGYSFVNAGPLTPTVTLLSVETDNLEALAVVVKRANDESKRTGPGAKA